MALRWAWLAVAMCFAGCTLGDLGVDTDAGAITDAGAGPASLVGLLQFPDAGAFEIHNVDSDGNLTGFAFVIDDTGLTCSGHVALDGGTLPVTTHRVYGGVLASAANAGPTPGTYQILQSFPAAGGFAAFVSYEELLPDGSINGPYLATDGTVTLTAAGVTELDGNFQATMVDDAGLASSLSGTFDAPFCP